MIGIVLALRMLVCRRALELVKKPDQEAPVGPKSVRTPIVPFGDATHVRRDPSFFTSAQIRKLESRVMSVNGGGVHAPSNKLGGAVRR